MYDGLTAFHEQDLQRDRDAESYLWYLDNVRKPEIIVARDQVRVTVVRSGHSLSDEPFECPVEALSAALGMAREYGGAVRIRKAR